MKLVSLMKLLMDDRELKNRLTWAKDKYPQLEPQVVRLEVGDYHYVLDDGRRVVFEYKTGSDFVKSMQNGHLHNQVYDMATNYDYTFIMVQVDNWNRLFDELWYRAGVSVDMNDIMGAIASFNLHTTVIVMSNRRDCFDMMLRQAVKVEQDKLLTPKLPKKTKNSAVNYLMTLHGLSDKTVKSIVDAFNPSCLQDLLDLTVEDIVSVDGIGKIRGEKIVEQIRGEQ